MAGSLMGLLLPLMTCGVPQDAVAFSAKLDADEVKRGGKYSIVVDVSFRDGLSP